MLEDGYMMIKTQTPCLLTCIKELNEPRYMSIGGIFDAYDKPFQVLGFDDLKDDLNPEWIGLKGSPTNVYKSFSPPLKGAGVMLKGSDREMVEQLFDSLSAKHII